MANNNTGELGLVFAFPSRLNIRVLEVCSSVRKIQPSKKPVLAFLPATTKDVHPSSTPETKSSNFQSAGYIVRKLEYFFQRQLPARNIALTMPDQYR